MAVALLALFVALGGSSYAALKIGSGQITDNSVRSRDLRNNDVRGADVRNGSLLRRDFRAGQLPAGRRGPQGATGSQGEPGEQGVQGEPGTSLFNASAIPSGVTVRGAWGSRYIAAQDVGGSSNSYLLAYSFPLSAPAPLRDADVNFGAGTTAAGDADAACTGTVDDPTAPTGKVCLYVHPGTRKDSVLTGFSLTAAGTTTDADRYGFTVRMVDDGTTNTVIRAEGTWAYRAP